METTRKARGSDTWKKCHMISGWLNCRHGSLFITGQKICVACQICTAILGRNVGVDVFFMVAI